MAKARIEISAVNNLQKGLSSSKQQLSEFQKFTSGIGDKLKQAFTFTAIIAGVKALTSAINDCVQATKTQLEADTRLQATIKATNQQFIASAAEIKQYASNLQSVTRFSDDVIESTAALLLASQKFDKQGLERTIELSADLAEAMGTDLPSAAQTLEKALVDPGEGLTRLRTIGITFTDSEKDMIEALKNAGKEFEAQQIILDKVEASYGGMAESLASIDTSTLDKIKNVWGDLKEDLGTLFTNTLGPVFDWIYTTLRWLERLMNQVAEKSNFDKYLHAQDFQSLADNFTSDYLNKMAKGEAGNYASAIQNLTTDTVGRYMNQILKKFQISIEGFLSSTFEEQQRMINAVIPSTDAQYGLAILEAADQGYIYAAIQKALQIQENDHLESLRLDAIKKEAQAAEDLKKTIDGWKKGSASGSYGYNAATAAALSGGIGGFLMSGWTGTLTGAHPMLGGYNMGLGMTQTDVYFDKMYDWFKDDMPKAVSTGIKFAFQSPDFGLPSNAIGALDNLSMGVSQNGGDLGIDSAEKRAQVQAANAQAYATLTESLGKAGQVTDIFIKNIQTMGPELGSLVTAFQFVMQGFSEAVGPMLDVITDLVLTPLIEVGKMLGSVIVPILQILAPVLKLIETPILVLSGIIQYVGQTLQHWVATLLNWMSGLNIMGWQPFAGLRTYDPGSPGKFGDYMENHLNGFGSTDVAASTSTKTAVSSASYRGATSVTINIYPSGPIVGDGGMRQFAQMIREEFDALDYYGVGA